MHLQRSDCSGEPEVHGRDNKRARLEDPKDRKRILDQKSRQDIRDVIVGLKEIEPTLKQFVESVRGSNISEDAIVRFMEVAPVILQLVESVGQSNLVELPHEGQNLIIHGIQEIKDLINELKEVAPVIPQMVTMLRECKTMAKDNGQNFANLGIMAEQQINENDEAANIAYMFLTDEYGNGCNLEELTNPAPSSYPSMGYMGILTESSNYNGDETVDDKKMILFFEKFDGSFKRDVKYSDFNGLIEELNKDWNKVGQNELPTYLTPIEKKIKAEHGDINTNCKLSRSLEFPIYLMFHVTMKEMDELNLERVTFTKLELWRDVILDGEDIGFNVKFAKDYLMKIARAYFGSKAKLYEEEKRLELDALRKILQLREECSAEIISFHDKSCNTGLFPNS